MPFGDAKAKRDAMKVVSGVSGILLLLGNFFGVFSASTPIAQGITVGVLLGLLLLLNAYWLHKNQI